MYRMCVFFSAYNYRNSDLITVLYKFMRRCARAARDSHRLIKIHFKIFKGINKDERGKIRYDITTIHF